MEEGVLKCDMKVRVQNLVSYQTSPLPKVWPFFPEQNLTSMVFVTQILHLGPIKTINSEAESAPKSFISSLSQILIVKASKMDGISKTWRDLDIPKIQEGGKTRQDQK